MVLSSEWQERAHQETDRTQSHVSTCIHSTVCGVAVHMCVSVHLLFVCCYREKEEDLEKKQFFINRKLRPLMQIPGICTLIL